MYFYLKKKKTSTHIFFRQSVLLTVVQGQTQTFVSPPECASLATLVSLTANH